MTLSRLALGLARGTLLLALALAAPGFARSSQDPGAEVAEGSEAATRRIAWRLAALDDLDAPAREWEAAATPAARGLLLRGATRAWRGQPRLAALVELALEELPADALVAARAAGPSAVLDAELLRRAGAAAGSPFDLCAACWRRGLVPPEGSAGSVQAAFLRVAADGLRAGVLPERNFAAVLSALPEPGELLAALAGRRLPDAEVVALLRLPAEAWALPDRLLRHLVLLDHRAEPAPADAVIAIASLLAAPDLPATARSALAAGLARHAVDLPASALANLTLAELPPDLRDLVLEQAPLSSTEELLLAAARDDDLESGLRRRAILRLLRGDGERHAAALLPLVRRDLPDPVLAALLAGLLPHAPAEAAAAVQDRHLPVGAESAAFALELRLRYGSEEERLALLPRVLDLPAVRRFRIARAAWLGQPSEAQLALFRAWTERSDPEIQSLARRLLAEVLAPAQVAEHYRLRLAAETRPEVREALVQALRELGDDASLPVYLDWLDSSEGRSHADAFRRAFLVAREPLALPMFRSWWQERPPLPEPLLDAAAAALRSEDAAARERLYQRLAGFAPALQSAMLELLQGDAAAADFARWRDGFLDLATPAALRAEFAVQLARSLPASASEVDELLRFLAGKARLGALPEGPWDRLVEAAVALSDGAACADRLARLRAIEADLGEQATGLRLARLRGQARRGDTGALSDQIAELLAFLDELPAADVAPARGELQLQHPEIHLLILGIASSAEAGDAGLLAALLAQGEAVAEWAPAGISLLADSGAVALARCAAWAREVLLLLEPLGSAWRPDSPADGLPPALWTDPAEVFAELQARLRADSASFDTSQVLAAARARWPEDRRGFDYSGWFAVAAGDLEEAARWFELSLPRSGTLAETRREPLLGLAVVEQLRAPEQDALARHLAEHLDAAVLLGLRLPVGLRPELRSLLPAPAPTRDRG